MKAWWWGLGTVIPAIALQAGMAFVGNQEPGPGRSQELGVGSEEKSTKAEAAKKTDALTDTETLQATKLLQRMAELRREFAPLQVELEKLRVTIVKARSLDPQKFMVDWETGKVVPIPIKGGDYTVTKTEEKP